MIVNDYKFPVMDTIESAWEKVKGAKATLLAVFGLIVLNLLFFGILGGILQYFAGERAGQIPTVIGMFIQVILTWGMIYIGIQRARDLPIQYTMFKAMFNLNLFIKMIGLYILQFLVAGLTVVIVLPLLFIDTTSMFMQIISIIVFAIWYVVLLYVLLKMFFAKAIVIDKRIVPWTAIRMSFELTKGNVWRILGYLIICILALLVSLLPLGIGLIWSIPFLFIAYGLAYRRMLEAHQAT
jgi:hypothetical protein